MRLLAIVSVVWMHLQDEGMFKLSVQQLSKLFQISTSEKKSQLISAVRLHFFKKIINSHLFLLVFENYKTICINFMFVYILFNIINIKNVNKYQIFVNSNVILRILQW